MRQPWQYERPACRNLEPDLFVEENRDNLPIAIAICRQCPHQTECAEYGINVMVIGVWGGLTSQQRADIAKRQGINREQVLELPRPYRRTDQ